MRVALFRTPMRSTARYIILLVATLPSLAQTPAPHTYKTLQASPGDLCRPDNQPPDTFRPIVTQTGVKSRWRPLPVTNTAEDKNSKRDYLVLVYDAERHYTAFYDYNSTKDDYTIVPNNGAFLPVIYTKEKVLVRVCNLHPTDTVSISGNSFTLPEQGADIRGTLPATVPALTPTLDTLGNANAAGSPFGPAGVSFGSPAPLTSIPIPGFTPGAQTNTNGYVDAVVNVSPEALAIETVALIRNAQDAINTIQELNDGDTILQANKADKTKQVVEGSIRSLQSQADLLLDNLNTIPLEGPSSLGWFNQRLAETLSLVTELNGLANGVSQAGLGARAVALRQNLEAILGIVKLVRQVDDDDRTINGSERGAPEPPKPTATAATTCLVCGGQPNQNKVEDAGPMAKNKRVYACQAEYYDLLHGKIPTGSTVPADTFTCRAFERYTMTRFLQRFNAKVAEILQALATAPSLKLTERAKELAKAVDCNCGPQPASKDLTNAIEAAEQEKTDAERAQADIGSAEDTLEKAYRARSEFDELTGFLAETNRAAEEASLKVETATKAVKILQDQEDKNKKAHLAALDIETQRKDNEIVATERETFATATTDARQTAEQAQADAMAAADDSAKADANAAANSLTSISEKDANASQTSAMSPQSGLTTKDALDELARSTTDLKAKKDAVDPAKRKVEQAAQTVRTEEYTALTALATAGKSVDQAAKSAGNEALAFTKLAEEALPSGGETSKQESDEAHQLEDQWRQLSVDLSTFSNLRKLNFGENLAQKSVQDIFVQILQMRTDLSDLDHSVSKIFSKLNDAYHNTFVEQTDALPPFTGNALERISINVQRNYTPFSITGGTTIGAAATASTASPASNSTGGKGASSQTAAASGASTTGGGGSPAPASPSGTNDVTVLMEVHHRATFNLVGGVLAIRVPTSTYATVIQAPTYPTNTGTATAPAYQGMASCNNGLSSPIGATVTAIPTTNSTPFYCIQATQTGSIQVAGMAGVEWFIKPRDYFPNKRGVLTRKDNFYPALLVASSVTSLGSAFIGGNIEPVNGFNFFAGTASANRQSFSQAALQTVYLPGPSNAVPTLTPVTTVKWGFSFGVGFDLSVFTQLFTKAAGPQLP